VDGSGAGWRWGGDEPSAKIETRRRWFVQLRSNTQLVEVALVHPRAVAFLASGLDEHAGFLQGLDGAPRGRLADSELPDGKAHRLAQVPSAKPHVVEVLVKASFLCLAASRAVLRRVEAALRGVDNRPLPRQRWAALFARCAQDILQCVACDRAPRRLEYDLQRLLLHEAPDPNRRSPLLEAIESGTHTFDRRRVHPGHVNSPLRTA